MCVEKLPSSQKAAILPKSCPSSTLELLWPNITVDIIIYCLPQCYACCYAIEIIPYIQFAICFFRCVLTPPSMQESESRHPGHCARAVILI